VGGGGGFSQCFMLESHLHRGDGQVGCVLKVGHGGGGGGVGGGGGFPCTHSSSLLTICVTVYELPELRFFFTLKI
jgi:hypothetical protein